MTVLTEGRHAAEHLVSEANGYLSRDAIIVASGANLAPGTVLGKVTTGTATSAVKASGANTGNGVMGAITVGGGALTGVYQLRVTKAVTNAGDFEIIDPMGEVMGIGSVAAAFAGGGLSFTLADGATDFVVGDGFDITVATTEKFKQLNPTATDGSQVADGILYGWAYAASADVHAVAHLRETEVNASEITWPAGITNTQQANATAQLRRKRIILR